MKGIVLICTGILLSASIISCSQIGTTSSACAKAGYYGDQTECQNSVSMGTCASTTVQANGANLVCWQSSISSSQTGNTYTSNTNSNTGVACGTGQAAPPWSMGAWTPTACAVGITQLTRTVTCDYNCACNGDQPSTTESCTPNLVNGKHYDTECTALTGVLEWIEGNRVCTISGATCPRGWTQFFNNSTPYTITSVASAQEHTNCIGGRKTVYSGSHNSFTPALMVESLVYCGARNCFGCTSWKTLKANVDRVACY